MILPFVLLAAALSPQQSVLIVTVDTLRPDALGWVAGQNATPNIDALAREGFRFPAAVSPAPVTLAAHGSLLTGLVPRRSGLRDNGQVLPEGVTTLAELLRKRGYATAAFVSGFPLSREFGLDRGFDHYDDALPDGPPDRRERHADGTTAAAVDWIAKAKAPWLVWVHYYDAHDPYEPPAAYRRAGPRGNYDGEVAYVDHAIGTLRRSVAGMSGLLSVLAADHGESLGEHGESTHGFFVYESTVRVPLVFDMPGRITAGESRAAARLVDVTPTLLDLVGVPAPSGLDGVSLVPLLSGRPQTVPPAVVETLRPWMSYGWAPLSALRDGDWKLIDAPRRELYDVAHDPDEKATRLPAETSRADRLVASLKGLLATPAGVAHAAPDAEAVERLRALGYVGAGSSVPGEAPAGLADPKDRIEAWNALGAAEEQLERRDYRGAVAAFDRVLLTEPDNRFALSRSGQALVELGRGDEAVRRLEKAVASGPEHPESRLALAQVLTRLGRPDAAVGQWMELTRLQPRSVSSWVGLGNALGLAHQAPRAILAFQSAVALQPRDAELVTRLAFAEHAAGRDADAAAHLTQASALAPARFEHAGDLGLLLAKLGKSAEARRWLAASRTSEPDYAEARFEGSARLAVAAGDEAAARSALREALQAAPALRSRAAADARLAALLP